MNRREAMKLSVKFSALSIAATAATRLLAKTPAQVEGPFHPLNIDNDLRQVRKDGPKAEGQEIAISGIVRNDKTGAPISGVMIEIWQADKNGKYNHPNDPLDISPDPNFQFWGRTTTAADGSYAFYSIKPGSYPADDSWFRPPHIHLRFLKRGYLDLTTQLYFAGEPLNDVDKILQRLSKNDQQKLIVDLEAKPDSNLHVGRFDVELEPA